MQRLKVKEVLKPSVSNGVFCILLSLLTKSMPPEANKKLLLGKVCRWRHVPYKRKAPVGTKKKTYKEGTDSHDQPADWSRNDRLSI